MNFILPLIYFILMNATTVLLTKKTFGKTLPLTMMISSLTLFFSQILFSTFLLGYLINILLAAIPIVYIIVFKYKKKDLNKFKNNMLTKGFYTFILIYITIYIFDYNRIFTVWDEYSHWGVMVKEMLRLDKFYSVNESTLMVHKDYPPIISIFELFYCKLIGTYKEKYLITALHLLSLSFFIPSICEEGKKFSKLRFIIKVGIIILSIFLAFLLFDGHGIINTIYTDYIMAIIVGYMLYIVITEKNITSNFSILTLSVSSCFLLLTKQMGLPLYLMIIFIYFVENLIKQKLYHLKNIKKLNKIKIIQILIILLVIPLLVWKLWNSYIADLGVKGQFELSDLNILELKDIITKNKGKMYQQEVIKNYSKALIDSKITTSYIKLTYISSNLLIIAILIIECLFMNNIIKKRKFIELIITFIIGSFGYAFVMFMLYMFSFGEIEGPILASFNRYMPTFILIGISTSLMIFFNYDNIKDKEVKSLKICLILVLILLFVQKPTNFKKLIPKIKKTPENLYEYHAKRINRKTENNSKIFLLAQNTEGDYQFAIKYYSNPRITNLYHFNLPTKDISNYEQYLKKNIYDYILQFDYLYIVNIDENTKEKYHFFIKENDIEIGKLYRIINAKNEIKLKEIL